MDEELESEAYEYNDEKLGGDNDNDNETEAVSKETVNESETIESANEETAANETEAVDFGSYTTPIDTSFIKTPAIGEDDEKNGFDPEKYETASELLESAEFKQEKNEAKDAYDKAQSAIDNVENEYQNFVKEKESITTEGLELPTLEDFTATMQSKLAEAKDAYDKISKDENIFRDYVNKYSSDWDDYNKSNPTKNDKFELAKSAYDKAKLAADKANANLEKVSNNVKSAYTTFLEKSAAAYLSDEMYVNINDLFDYKTSKFKEGSKSYKDKDGNNYDINVTTKDGITTITASNKTNDGYTAENTIKVPNNTAGIELAITKSVEFSKKANDEFNKAEANARQSIELKEAAAADLRN